MISKESLQLWGSNFLNFFWKILCFRFFRSSRKLPLSFEKSKSSVRSALDLKHQLNPYENISEETMYLLVQQKFNKYVRNLCAIPGAKFSRESHNFFLFISGKKPPKNISRARKEEFFDSTKRENLYTRHPLWFTPCLKYFYPNKKAEIFFCCSAGEIPFNLLWRC